MIQASIGSSLVGAIKGIIITLFYETILLNKSDFQQYTLNVGPFPNNKSTDKHKVFYSEFASPSHFLLSRLGSRTEFIFLYEHEVIYL